MKRGEKWFSEKLRKNFDLANFWSDLTRYVPPVSRAAASELVLQRGRLPSEIALPGEAKGPKLCIEGWVRTLKSKNIFSANNEQGSIKGG